MNRESEPARAGKEADRSVNALLAESAEELYESATCGYLSTLLDGTIVRINTTLLEWLGLERSAVVGRMRFAELLTMGGRLYHETHFAPLLRMRGEIGGIALEMRTPEGGRLPVLVSSVLKHDGEGEPLLIRTTVFDATDRRSYEEELLHRRREADRARAEAEQAHRQAEADRERLRETLTILQRALLPDALPEVPGMEAASYYHTASLYRLGGDFYDLFPIDDTRWAFFLGDVSGKGPQAATLTSQARYVLRAAALYSPEPAHTLRTLNTVLSQSQTDEGDPRYCTAVFGLLEPEVGTDRVRLRIAFGGHPPALLLRADGRTEFLFAQGGMLVGVLPDAHFATTETTLAPGDTFLVYTDGLTEARTGAESDTMFGEQALLSFTAGVSPCAPKELIAAMGDLLKGFGDGLNDDTALLSVGVPVPRDQSASGTA